MNGIAEQIRATFNSLWAEDHDDPPPPLLNETILLETGFDSMAFAVLVAQLDDDLGVDPFALDMDADPPITFADFVGFYERCIAATEGHVPGTFMLQGDGGALSNASEPTSAASIHA